jgi:hypothetical protein
VAGVALQIKTLSGPVRALVAAEVAKWTDVLRRPGIQLE